MSSYFFGNAEIYFLALQFEICESNRMKDDPLSMAFMAATKYLFETSGKYDSQKEFRLSAKIPTGTASEILSGKSAYGRKTQAKVARAFGYDLVDFLAIGQRLLQDDPPVQAIRETAKAYGTTGADEYRSVPRYESGRLAAGVNGLGFDPYELPSADVVIYRPELAHRSRHDLRAMRVGGDSMAPVIPRGAIVVIDLDDKEFADRKIFAVAIEEGGVDLVATVKRVRKMDGAFVLLPENRDYLPEITRADWSEICVGRVVWLWRSLEND